VYNKIVVRKYNNERLWWTMMKNNKVLLINTLFIAFMLLLAGCSDDTATSKKEKTDVDITSEIKEKHETAVDASIELKDGVVYGTISVEDSVDEETAKEIVEDFSKELAKKYNENKIAIEVNKGEENVTTVEVYNGNTIEMPSYKVTDIMPGLMEFNRLVVITLDTDHPENYDVIVYNKKLMYSESKKIFAGIVDSQDEELIRNSVTVWSKKE
jgi:hypothetical protein